MISPKFEEMSKKYTDIACFKVDVDEAEDVAAACEITAMPTFQFFKNGAKVAEFKGKS
jgi:thiol-disulfide isomerase/thioredoxin